MVLTHGVQVRHAIIHILELQVRQWIVYIGEKIKIVIFFRYLRQFFDFSHGLANMIKVPSKLHVSVNEVMKSTVYGFLKVDESTGRARIQPKIEAYVDHGLDVSFIHN